MVQSNEKKNLMLAIGGGAILIGAALLYHFAFADDDESSGQVEGQILDELKEHKLDEIKKTPQGQLDPMYFCQLLNYIGLRNKAQTTQKRNELTQKRREAYKTKDWDTYKSIVFEQMSLEEENAQGVVKEVIETLNISEQEFGMTFQGLAQNQNPQVAQMVMAAQAGKLPNPNAPAEKPKLTKQKTLQVFKESSQMQLEMMKKMASMAPPDSNNPQEQMMQAMAEQFKMQDECFIRTGCEQEDMEQSLAVYKDDPEVLKIVMAEMQKMQGAMQASGMGGMPGM